MSMKPLLPIELLNEFKQWYVAQRKPAVALVPDPSGEVGSTGSRLGGPAWIAEDASWPIGANGRPLELLAQLDLSDCKSLDGWPHDGCVQFFIARDDVLGVDHTDPIKGRYLIQFRKTDNAGALHSPPPDDLWPESSFELDSPFADRRVRDNGIALKPEPFEDCIDSIVKDADLRIRAFESDYDLTELHAFIDQEQQTRRIGHHSGGYPAFVQQDIRHIPAYADYDQVLLRLSYDDFIMWGDAGEAVFMIRSSDLAARDFSKVTYSWDCC